MSATPMTELDYRSKASAYFSVPRSEMLPYIPATCRRLLEVGCGIGRFGETLKQTRNMEVWGVEPLASAAQVAATKLDHVTTGLFDPQNGLPEASFDCIVFNDVLEHMVAPEKALQYAKKLLSPGGTVVASIPNIRHVAVLWQLGFHGRWEYTDWGLLDRTHLRFFTKSNIVDMFKNEGYVIERVSGINFFVGNPPLNRTVWRLYRLLNACCFGKLNDMGFQQFAVVAKTTATL